MRGQIFITSTASVVLIGAAHSQPISGPVFSENKDLENEYKEELGGGLKAGWWGQARKLIKFLNGHSNWTHWCWLAFHQLRIALARDIFASNAVGVCQSWRELWIVGILQVLLQSGSASCVKRSQRNNRESFAQVEQFESEKREILRKWNGYFHSSVCLALTAFDTFRSILLKNIWVISDNRKC